MEMRKEMYKRRADALRAAERYADEHHGFVRPCDMADSHMMFDYEDDAVQRMSWSGETAAFGVLSLDSYDKIGLFAYWGD